MRAAAKEAAEQDPQDETSEKADRLRAMVRIMVKIILSFYNAQLLTLFLTTPGLLLFQERVSLKHRNTSKWAKHLMTKGSKNAEVR